MNFDFSNPALTHVSGWLQAVIFNSDANVSGSSMPAKKSSNFSRHSQRKKQTQLAFDPVEPSTSVTVSPARVRYQLLSPQPKAFDLLSPEQAADGEANDIFPSGKKGAVVVETPGKRKKNGRIPFKPLATPVRSSQTESGSAKSTGELLVLIIFFHYQHTRISLPLSLYMRM